MRLRLLLLTSLAAIAALVACEDDSGTPNPGTFDPDSGTYTPPDASSQDANVPQGDASPDATTDAEPPATDVTVHVTNGKGPAANVTIVYHDASGAVIGTSKTDATGTAKSTGATPAQVTALLGRGSAKNLLTWTSVAAGDELFANDVDGGEEAAPNLDVTLPGPYANAYLYTAQIGTCTGSSGQSGSVQLYLYGDCAKAKNAVLATALGDGLPLAFAFKKGVELPTDGGVATTTVGAWAAPSTFTIAASHAPVDTYVDGWLAQIADGSSLPSDVRGLGEDPTTFHFASAFADGLQPAAFVQEGRSVVSLVERVATSATSASFDFATALPKITEANVDATDALHPNLTWTAAAPLTASNGGFVTVSFYDGRDASMTWSFVVPPSATSVKAPSLPAEADDWAPRAADGGSDASSFSDPEVLFVESGVIADYKFFRREAGRLLPNDYAGDYRRAARAILPTVGKLRATAFAIQPG